MGRESKGSTAPSQSGVSDQNAGRRDNLSNANLHREHGLASACRWTENPLGAPCPPGMWLNPAMEHTDNIERDSEHLERRRFCTLLRDLTQPDRALLEWRVVDGWGYAEIARRLGIPRADLVKRVHRIRTDLRRRVKALGAGETKLDIAATMTV